MKICTACDIEKVIEDFHASKNGLQGRQTYCKPCVKIKSRTYLRKIKQEVVDAYGGYCSCCGESEICFLAIDHVFGGANKEEGLKRGGHKFYLWLKRQGYPKDKYRLLCHNCNMGREANGGVCPHQTRSKHVQELVETTTNKEVYSVAKL